MASRPSQTVINFEVYVLDRKRWVLHARFGKQDREAALLEAKNLDRQPGVAGVKVVRETYFPATNKMEDSTVFISARTRQLTADAQGFDYDDPSVRRRVTSQVPAEYNPNSKVEDAYEEGQKRYVPVTAWGVTGRIILITLASLAFGAVVSAATALVMSQLGRYGILAGTESNSVLFGAFLIGFVICALPMLFMFVSSLSGGEDESEIYDFEPAPEFEEEDTPKKRPWWKISLGGSHDKGDEMPQPEQEAAPEESPQADLWQEPEEQPEPTPEPEPEPEATEEPAPEETPPPAEEEEFVPTSPDFEMHRMSVMRFLGGAVAALKASKPQLDAYTKFAIDLALAGATEIAAARGKLAKNEQMAILRQAIEVIGTKPELAKSFCERYDDYVKDPRYEQMAQTGRESMIRLLDGKADPFGGLPSALQNWGKPQIKSNPLQSIMTIIFTDMVGSTDLTQAVGDVAAQEVVRRHNAIVRSAISEHSGREIKHTGDGIMASFPTAGSGVEACIDIQRAIVSFNATKPELELHVRIGINSGEPIVEENDLFGATVQLAARICAKAGTDQIYCSNSVRDLYVNKSHLFFNLGPVELKGFKEPIPIYEVKWKEKSSALLPISQDLPDSLAPEATPAPDGGIPMEAAPAGAPGNGSPAAQDPAAPGAAPGAAALSPAAPAPGSPPAGQPTIVKSV
jgi:adenylate cyclase